MANVIKLITIEINNMTMIEIINTPAMVVDRATVILMAPLLLPSKASKLKSTVSIIIVIIINIFIIIIAIIIIIIKIIFSSDKSYFCCDSLLVIHFNHLLSILTKPMQIFDESDHQVKTSTSLQPSSMWWATSSSPSASSLLQLSSTSRYFLEMF